MKFSSTVTLQYDTPFSPFPASEFEASLQWLKESGFDGAEREFVVTGGRKGHTGSSGAGLGGRRGAG